MRGWVLFGFLFSLCFVYLFVFLMGVKGEVLTANKCLHFP